MTTTSPPAPFDEWTGRWNRDTPADPEELRAWQLDHAWMLAERLARQNPFYRHVVLPSERGEADFRTLPVTTKADVVRDCQGAPPYGTRTVALPSDMRHIVQTSGTSGQGQEVYVLDAEDEAAVFRAEAVGFWWAGVRPGTRVLLTLPVSLAAAGQWYRGGLALLGANVICAGSYSTEAKAELLWRFHPQVVVGTPSYLQKLAAGAEVHGDLGELGTESIVVAGEGYGLDWARRLEKRWSGAVLYEQYGCTERIMAWACPVGVVNDTRLGVLHVPPELAYWEVLDLTSGEPAEDGEYGELVTTPLQATASPLLRFATGDLVQFVSAGSCACGRPASGFRAGGVRRADAMLKIRGVNVWPEALDIAVFSVGEVVEYRGSVTSSDAGEVVTIEVEPGDGGGDSTADAVRNAVLAATGLSVKVSLVAPGTIQGSIPPGFVKVSRWSDHRETALSRAEPDTGGDPASAGAHLL